MIGHTPLSLCGARNCGKPLNECSFMCEWEKSEGGSVCVCVCVCVGVCLGGEVVEEEHIVRKSWMS